MVNLYVHLGTHTKIFLSMYLCNLYISTYKVGLHGHSVVMRICISFNKSLKV